MMIDEGLRRAAEEDFDAETGEIPASTSGAAIDARKASETTIEGGSGLYIALAAAVSELPVWIKQDAEVNVTTTRKMKYATLKTILATVRHVLLSHGIRIRQGAMPSFTLDGGGIKGRLVPIYTDLIHSATGQIDRTTIEIPVTKLDAQAMGSAMSYGRRYSLLAALGLATDESDDDGAGTKTKALNEEQEESQELWVLKEEINGIDDAKKLHEWAERLKATRRADGLSEGELALMRAHYKSRLKSISESPEKTEKVKK